MVHFTISRSHSSTSCSSALHELAPSLLSSAEITSEDSSKQPTGRRLSKMRTKISATLSKASFSQSIQQAPNHTLTLPHSRPKIRRALSRSMIAPLQNLFTGDHLTSELEIPERYDPAAWSPGMTKSSSTFFSRRAGTPSLCHRTTCDDKDWDFRCQGIAPVIPARPSEEALSPGSIYDHALLGSPGLLCDSSFATSSASSCCSSPMTPIPPIRSFSADNAVKKQKICVNSISNPLNLWTRSPSPLLAPPPHHLGSRLGLDVQS